MIVFIRVKVCECSQADMRNSLSKSAHVDNICEAFAECENLNCFKYGCRNVLTQSGQREVRS